MTHNRRVLLSGVFTLALCSFGLKAAYAQSGVSLEAEIQTLEKAASAQGVSAQERRGVLVKLAQLRQLSGDIEGAAKNWLEAAIAIPGKVDDDALLSCAYCLAAMGEWDRAATALDPLLAKSARARFLDTGIKAIRTGDTSTLGAIADISEYNQMKSEILFMLWKLSDKEKAENWRKRLIAEFPDSPEGRLAAGAAASSIAIKPSPFWLLLGMLDIQAGNRSSAAPVQPVPNAAQLPALKLQTGIFGNQANARAHMEKLKSAGFSPVLEQRGEMWAVIVPAETDANRVSTDLRAAGFESFIVK
ncbi:MAG: SPOR domain-containing protein [Treponema sp.]|nr:SPOR domain-containing protein [Treponema sp.]